ncbi:2999_t:CDS:1, partial [Cetraspora pellucida]
MSSTSSIITMIQYRMKDKDDKIKDLKKRIEELEQKQNKLNEALKQDSLKFILVLLT